MSWWAWLWLGGTVGLCLGVLLMALLVMARDPGAPSNPEGDEGGQR